MKNSSMMTKNNKVVLGLSGGVDSTAATLLLKEKGYIVTGLFFDVLGDQKSEIEKAKKAAEQMGIDFIYKDVSKEFNDIIIEYFCKSYIKGATPNPCIRCNPLIKFKILSDTADHIGAQYISTGHYANVVYDNQVNKHFIHRSKYLPKDQSYMLYRLKQDVLSRLLLPLGNMASKDMVRDLVGNEGISSAHAKDSQEICFVKDNDYVNIIRKSGYDSVPGDFLDTEGNIIGQHKGLIHYTIGQRKGLGMTFGKPRFVTYIDPANNTVTLGDNDDLFHTEVFSKDAIFTLDGSGIVPSIYCDIPIQAKLRYAASPAEAILLQEEDGVRVQFTKPQRAPTPGQSIVFYQDSRVIGGAIIQS